MEKREDKEKGLPALPTSFVKDNHASEKEQERREDKGGEKRRQEEKSLPALPISFVKDNHASRKEKARREEKGEEKRRQEEKSPVPWGVLKGASVLTSSPGFGADAPCLCCASVPNKQPKRD